MTYDRQLDRLQRPTVDLYLWKRNQGVAVPPKDLKLAPFREPHRCVIQSG